ncbi:MAG: SRPBCC domain-containing protein [Leptospiraceae bacterium]|nr:SRPBCC domain-containing protein [Leptospiraceae bacterium]
MQSEQKGVKLELRGETDAVLTRYFAAPRELIFDYHTKPELMRKWLIGPGGMKLDVCENDLRAGGKYLYAYADEKGKLMGVYGHFIEVAAPETLTNTENYMMDMETFDPNAAEDPAATVESRVFSTDGESTLVTHTCTYASAEVRGMMMDSGMVDALEECYRKLEECIRENH